MKSTGYDILRYGYVYSDKAKEEPAASKFREKVISKFEAALSSETLVYIYQTTLYNNTKDCSFHFHLPIVSGCVTC
jgi:hypothetical protein